MGRRRRFNLTLGEHLSAFIHAMRERAELVGAPAHSATKYSRKSRRLRAQVEMDRAVNSPKLKPPNKSRQAD
jgi:hypothetical protein